MDRETQSLLEAALKLPEAERTLLVDRQLESLPPEDEFTEDELFEELEWRRAEVEQGKVKPVPWSEVCSEE
jgi:putative addiction module component (TIGR02574 family)